MFYVTSDIPYSTFDVLYLTSDVSCLTFDISYSSHLMCNPTSDVANLVSLCATFIQNYTYLLNEKREKLSNSERL